jgi:hypothetical protein
MQLNDILPDISCSIDGIDYTTEIMEVFDQTLPYKLTNKQKTSNSIVFIYTINNTDPVIYVQIKVVQYNNQLVGEVSFFTKETSFELTGASNEFSIIGTVIHICELLPAVKIWYFSAKFGNDSDAIINQKRTKIYSIIAKKLAVKRSLNYKSINIAGDTIYILSDNTINNNQIIHFIQQNIV